MGFGTQELFVMAKNGFLAMMELTGVIQKAQFLVNQLKSLNSEQPNSQKRTS
jgi:hypothetical protein